MFGFGMPEMLVILVIVVIVFGTNRLPALGSGLGKGIRNFKEATRKPPEIHVTPQPQEQVEEEQPKEEQA
jgi:sec-independent protein translocase protein TatA